MEEESVSQWLTDLKDGDEMAVQHLWERYFEKLVVLARRKLAAAPRAMADEEDVALSAFGSFCRNAAAGRFPRLSDRDDLWKLLFTLTERKSINHRKHESREKRGGGQNTLPIHRDDSQSGMQQLVDREPSPDHAAQMVEEMRLLFAKLNDETLCQIAVMKMEGYTNTEIAMQLNLSNRTIIRKLKVIRSIWSH